MKKISLLFLAAGALLFAGCGGDDDKKDDQAIIFDELPALSEGAEYTLSATSSSGLPVSFRSTDENYASVEGNKLRALKSGTVTIVASQKGNDSYYEAPEIRRLLTVNAYSADKQDQTVAFTLDVAEWKLSQGVLSLKGYATASSGLPVTFTSSRESAAKINSNGEMEIVFGIEMQTITIYAGQPGNSEYNPAPTVSQKINVVCDLH